jgi:hypothetical protein
MQRLKSWHGWLLIAAYAVVHDNLALEGETISEGFWRAPKPLVWTAWGYLTAHLVAHAPLPIRFLKIR